MTEKKENISVFLDGESSEFESASALRELKQEAGMRHRWEGYHLIGDAIRNNLSAAVTVGFSDRLMLALEQETAHVAPRQTTYRRINDTAGFALAASVSAVAIVGLLQFGQPAMMTEENKYYDTDIQQQYSASTTLSSHRHNVVAVTTSNFDIDNQALAYASFDDASLNQAVTLVSANNLESTVYDYLVNFSQYAVAAPLQGSVPIINLTSYTL